MELRLKLHLVSNFLIIECLFIDGSADISRKNYNFYIVLLKIKFSHIAKKVFLVSLVSCGFQENIFRSITKTNAKPFVFLPNPWYLSKNKEGKARQFTFLNMMFIRSIWNLAVDLKLAAYKKLKSNVSVKLGNKFTLNIKLSCVLNFILLQFP